MSVQPVSIFYLFEWVGAWCPTAAVQSSLFSEAYSIALNKLLPDAIWVFSQRIAAKPARQQKIGLAHRLRTMIPNHVEFANVGASRTTS